MTADWSDGTAAIGQAGEHPIYGTDCKTVGTINSPVIRVAISKSFRERVAGDFELRDLKQTDRQLGSLGSASEQSK
jgi:hypothetical protein